MDIGVIAYPFLFAAIYFEVFLLLTFLSKPARLARTRGETTIFPSVAMIVPCYNEEATVEATAQSLLALEYPADKLRIVLVDDGSTDRTGTIIDQFANNPRVSVIHKVNGGKHTALNAGINVAKDAELIGCLDADSFVEQSALKKVIPCFKDERVGAATSAMLINNPKNVLEHMQSLEYMIGVALRHILASVNGLYVTPGPFSLYRRSIIEKLGGFRKGFNTEDMEMALRFQKAGYAIDNAPRALVFTTAPKNVPALVKQRVRWTTGFLRNMIYDYRDLIGNPRYGALGILVLPLGIVGIASGITLFVLFLYFFSKNIIDGLTTSAGVPLAYTLTNLIPANLEWFYFPITFFLLLVVIATLGTFIFMFMGTHVSNTETKKVGPGLIAYMALYGLLTPFWFLFSVADVAFGTRRAWK